MIELMSKQNQIKLFGFVFAISLLVHLAFKSPHSFLQAGAILWSSASVAAILIVAVGQSRLFPAFCRLPGISRLIPDIDGAWTGEVFSNWSRDDASTANPPVAGGPGTSVDLKVTVRLFSVRVDLVSDRNYSRSVTEAAHPWRGKDEALHLSYIFENTTDAPVAGDSSHHLGAARLRFEEDRGVITGASGPYWTNRNWTNGMNTAGTISLRRRLS